MNTNYVIACWTGARRADDRRAIKDRTFMIRSHLDALEASGHSLTQITIVLAEGGDPDADRYIKSIKNVGGTPVSVLARVNNGFSYGSWNHAFETYKKKFDYYILVEDDYAPWLHHFDKFLVEQADAKGSYVCSLAGRNGRIAAISNGVVSSDVWAKVHPAPHVNRGSTAQIMWTAKFGMEGPISDYTEKFSSPFWDVGGVKWFGDMHLSPLFVPVHMIGQKHSLQNPVAGRRVGVASPGVDGWCIAEQFGHVLISMPDGVNIEHRHGEIVQGHKVKGN